MKDEIKEFNFREDIKGLLGMPEYEACDITLSAKEYAEIVSGCTLEVDDDHEPVNMKTTRRLTDDDLKDIRKALKDEGVVVTFVRRDFLIELLRVYETVDVYSQDIDLEELLYTNKLLGEERDEWRVMYGKAIQRNEVLLKVIQVLIEKGEKE